MVPRQGGDDLRLGSVTPIVAVREGVRVGASRHDVAGDTQAVDVGDVTDMSGNCTFIWTNA
jgi:hypothetical protein